MCMFTKYLNLTVALSLFLSCSEDKKDDPFLWIPLEVTATAYNSVKSQTMGKPNITAWGDTLVPGIKSIAVSRDLIRKGLKYNTMVRIDAFPDTFYVKDKMHRRWKNRIDIYMGKDIQLARKWGRQKVKIQYAVLREDVDSLTRAELDNKE